MAPPRLFDLSAIDLNATALDRVGIMKYIAQRGLALQLDKLAWFSEDHNRAVAVKHVRDDEWWSAGHVPGQPLMPAVMMIEAGAQLASVIFQIHDVIHHKFIGFTAIDRTKFRGVVHPGDDLIILGQVFKFHPRRMICDLQGWVGDDLIYESRITGMPIDPDGGSLTDALADSTVPVTPSVPH